MPQPVVKSSFAEHSAIWDMGFHSHDSFEISVVLHGRGHFECQNVIYPIETGNVVIIHEQFLHAYRAETDIRFAVLEANHMPVETKKLFHQLTPIDKPDLKLLSPIALEQYEGLFRQWLRMISQPLKQETRCITTWVDLLILFLLQYQNDGPLSISVASSADHIRSNLKSEISISELAKQCGLSESAYRSQFKEAFNVSPKQYHQSCRAAEAKWLLRTTNRSIQLIAEQVGFSGVHSFSAWFQKNEGVSPSDWRKIQQGRP
ncbi:AraC family transcriptional regulator [Paenibacillus filicis]|uniref:AraC family transcriptional regulator n=1 Tax=Paenibacillus gyeongsangnamensis TaxID=3388067 RepID=A0ABT4Q4G6_9BACL|nr:response regulator transcription factor [Paenibacillus filicis]MCZ8511724.1 AraC family transcriptional regulator [Paenibacillus filicis]